MTDQIQLKSELLIQFQTSVRNPAGGYYYESFGLRYIKGNSDSYFTFGIFDDRAVTRFQAILGKDVYKQAKAILEPLHLSDTTGAPMHTIENGYYYVEIARGVAKYHKPEPNDQMKYTEILANHLRISFEEADFIITSGMNKEQFTAIVDELRPRWKNEALAAYRYLESIRHLSHI